MFAKLFGGGKKEQPKESKNKVDEALQTLDKKLNDLELLKFRCSSKKFARRSKKKIKRRR